MLNEVKTRNIISGLIPPLSATILLTLKQSEIGTLSEILGIEDMYSASWKQVKSDIFCKKSGAPLVWTVYRKDTNGPQENQI